MLMFDDMAMRALRHVPVSENKTLWIGLENQGSIDAKMTSFEQI